MPQHYIYLIAAVIAETIGTSSMQASQQFTRLVPSAICVVSFLIALFLMSLALKAIPVGILYSMWSGLGIVSISIIGYVVFGQKLDLMAVLGMSMILGGILVIHLFSNTATH